MEALQVIGQMPETKSQIEHFANLITQSVEDGVVNPLDLYVRLNAAEAAIKAIKDKIKEQATSEADKYGKSFEYKNAKIDVKQVGVKYDFSNCCDTAWELQKSIETDASEKRKERETFLKGIKGQLTMVDEMTGEIVTIFEPVKRGAESIVVTINK